MSNSDRLSQIAQELQEGKIAPSVTVREFLSWFGAQRRGVWIVSNIRQNLNHVGLRTEPDFESAYIDSDIGFRLMREPPIEGQFSQTTWPATITADGMASPIEPLKPPVAYADPTYRISKLSAANNLPICVAPDDTLREAVTLMLAKDFSQLPVMTSEREVKGVISWTSIATRLSLGKSGRHARELMDVPPQEIRADASIFQAIPIIAQFQYVLVRAADNRITGIVTTSDLNQQFQQQAEPFLLLGEIENHIRRIIGDRFSPDELTSARDPGDSERKVDRISDLTYGEYIRLLENPDRWAKVNLSIDRSTFCRELDLVRSIRNDVMHFDPDGIPPKDLDRLRDFTKFLNRLQALGIP